MGTAAVQALLDGMDGDTRRPAVRSSWPGLVVRVLDGPRARPRPCRGPSGAAGRLSRMSAPAHSACPATLEPGPLEGAWDLPAALIPPRDTDLFQAAGATVARPPPGQAPDAVGRLDGLAMAGGADMDAALYGAEPDAPPPTSRVGPAMGPSSRCTGRAGSAACRCWASAAGCRSWPWRMADR